MGHVTSKDGTRITFDRLGEGPPLVIVGGGLDDGSESAPLATELAGDFTVYNYARRGRGDTLPYALDREIEDIDALIAEAGGSAHLYGVSSGGALALEAALTITAIDRVAVYEVPYAMSGDAVTACLGDGRPPRERLATLTNRTLVATGAGRDPHTAQLPPGFFDDAADALAATVTNARRAKLEAQGHVADPAAMAPLLTEFLTSP